MAKMTPEQVADKLIRNLSQAGEYIAAGIDRVSVAPGELAAKKQEKMKARLIAAIDSGKWASRVRSVDLATWKAAAREKGVPRIASGIAAARPKIIGFMNQLLPHIDAGVAIVDKMPDLTLEDGLARSRAMIMHMAKLKYNR